MRKRICLVLTMLLMMIPAAAAENAVLDLRGHTHVTVQFAADAPVLTVVYPQMTFADACILVCDGHAAMIDAGGYAQEEAVMSAIEQMGITAFDWVVCTHPHHDHEPGFEAVVSKYPVGQYITSFPENENDWSKKMAKVLVAAGVPAVSPSDGDVLTLGRAEIRLILPENTGKTVNNRSLLTMVSLGERRMLMLADIETMGQEALLSSGDDVHADILKYPHHGHAAMNKTLLNVIAPSLCVITAKPTRAPYAGQQLEKARIKAAYTDSDGIVFRTDGQVWLMQDLSAVEF